MKFVLRVDDCGWRVNPAGEKARDDGLGLLRRLHEILAGRPWLAAVMPGWVDDEGARWLRSHPDGMTVALHGWDHSDRGARDEFYGLTLDEIVSFLRQGKERLAPLEPQNYVPPFNSVSPWLYMALREVGIVTAWVGPTETVVQPFVADDIRVVPAFGPLYGASVGRVSADSPVLLDALPAWLDTPGVAVVTLHITWEHRLREDLSGVEELLEAGLGDRLIQPSTVWALA